MKKNGIKPGAMRHCIWGVLFFVCSMQGGRQKVTIYNQTIQSIFIVLDLLPYTPLERSVILQGQSKNFFIAGLENDDRTFYLIVDSSDGPKQFTLEYKRKKGVILLKRGTLVIDSVSRTVIDPSIDIKIGITNFLDAYFIPTGRCVSKKTVPCWCCSGARCPMPSLKALLTGSAPTQSVNPGVYVSAELSSSRALEPSGEGVVIA